MPMITLRLNHMMGNQSRLHVPRQDQSEPGFPLREYGSFCYGANPLRRYTPSAEATHTPCCNRLTYKKFIPSHYGVVHS